MPPAAVFGRAAAGTAEASFRADLEQLPLIENAIAHDLQFVQKAGDVVWIPSGWCVLCCFSAVFLLFFHCFSIGFR